MPRSRDVFARATMAHVDSEKWRHVVAYLCDVWNTGRALVVACAVSRMVGGITPIVMLWVWMLTVDAALEVVAGRTASADKVWKYIGLELALAVGADLVSRGGALAARTLGDRFSRAIGIRLMRHAQTFDLSTFEDAEFLDRLERARRETGKRLALLLSLLTIVQDCLGLLTFGVLFSSMSGYLVFFLFLVAIPTCLGETHFAVASHSLFKRRSKDRRLLEYLRYLCASSQAVKEVKTFGLVSYFIDLYGTTAEGMERESNALATRRAIVGAVLNVLTLIGYYGSCVLVLRMFLERIITVGALAFSIRALSRTRALVEHLTSQLAAVTDEIHGISDLYACLNQPGPASRANGSSLTITSIRFGFELRDVGFQYPGAARWALRHVTLRFPMGETIALVGPNGAGKTSLLNLLLGLYKPTEGRILLDGNDLDTYSREDLQRRVGTVFQDFVRYDLSVRENIGFGDVAALNDEARVRAAAAASGSLAMIERFPNGLEQVVGHRFEGGTTLSGGEWQRLALARAYVGQRDVLILDEPTSALDPLAERELFEEMTGVGARRLVILVSHRFSAARLADRVVVLNGGTVQEEGTHDQLVANGGRYATLFEMQAAGYRRSANLAKKPAGSIAADGLF